MNKELREKMSLTKYEDNGDSNMKSSQIRFLRKYAGLISPFTGRHCMLKQIASNNMKTLKQCAPGIGL